MEEYKRPWEKNISILNFHNLSQIFIYLFGLFSSLRLLVVKLQLSFLDLSSNGPRTVKTVAQVYITEGNMVLVFITFSMLPYWLNNKKKSYAEIYQFTEKKSEWIRQMRQISIDDSFEKFGFLKVGTQWDSQES